MLTLALGGCGPVFTKGSSETEIKPKTNLTTNLGHIPLIVKGVESESRYLFSQPVEVRVNGVEKKPALTACEVQRGTDEALIRTYFGLLPLAAGENQLEINYGRIDNKGDHLRHSLATAAAVITYNPDYSTAGTELLYLFSRAQKVVYVLEVKSGELLGKIDLDVPDASDYQLELIGRNLLVYNGQRLTLIDTASNKSAGVLDFSVHFPAGESPSTLSASEDGRTVYFGYKNFLYVVERETNRRVAMFPVSREITHLRNAHLSGRLLVAAQSSIYAFSLQDYSGLGEYSLPADLGGEAVIEKLFLSSDHQQAAALVRWQPEGEVDRIQIVDTMALTGVGEVRGSSIAGRNVAFSPDKSRLYFMEGSTPSWVVAVSVGGGRRLWVREGDAFSLTSDGGSVLMLEDDIVECNLMDRLVRLDALTGEEKKKNWLGMDLQGVGLVHKP